MTQTVVFGFYNKRAAAKNYIFAIKKGKTNERKKNE